MILRKGGKDTQKNYTKKDLNDLDDHDGVITHLEPDILESKVKWALGSITTNKASGGDGIPAELFQVLKDDQIANICLIVEKAREFQKNIYFCFIDYAKAFDCVDHNKLWKFLKSWKYQTTLPASSEICM